MIATARDELAKLMGHLGEPVITRFLMFKRARSPKWATSGRMKTLGERLETLPDVYVIGNGYNGTGIPDCVKQGRAAAEEIAPKG